LAGLAIAGLAEKEPRLLGGSRGVTRRRDVLLRHVLGLPVALPRVLAIRHELREVRFLLGDPLVERGQFRVERGALTGELAMRFRVLLQFLLDAPHGIALRGDAIPTRALRLGAPRQLALDARVLRLGGLDLRVGIGALETRLLNAELGIAALGERALPAFG